MELWTTWFDLVSPLRNSCSRKRTFFWLVIILIGFTIKTDFFGVTSIARGAGLLPTYYTCMLNFFSSQAISLDKLQTIWVKLVFDKFHGAVKLNGMYLLVADGIKVGKEGKKMPGVKWLHQDSESNAKAEYIMGHSLQAIALVVEGVKGYFAVPLTARIHEGIRYHWNDKRSLLDKLFESLVEINISGSYYLAVDKYYCSGRLMKQLVSKGIHIITMMKKNAVAYYPPEEKNIGRGRPKIYGVKVKLFDLFSSGLSFISAPMPNNPAISIEYCVIDLLWKPLGGLAMFVFVKHPVRGNAIVMTTDLTIPPLELILGYALRFKIEVLFKQAVHQLGTFMYRFWLKTMAPKKRGKGSKESLLQFAPKDFKEKVKNKINAYHLFIQLGLIAQGLLQYLSVYHYDLIWKSFGSWLRTVRNQTLPSEKVVAMAMARTYHLFMKDAQHAPSFKKFLWDRSYFRENIEKNDDQREAA